MSPKAPATPPVEKGNYVSEWYTHRVYPTVRSSEQSLSDQKTQRCPTLSEATKETRRCIKPENAQGICTISSTSNGIRQDWLVCPFRALDPFMMGDAARQMFQVPSDRPVVLIAGPAVTRPEVRESFVENLRAGGFGGLFLQSKLGGEISVSATDRSPEMSFDFTIVEIKPSSEGSFETGKYGILEIQTMDFHGSYKSAVRNLSDALRLHNGKFAEELQRNPKWLSERIEGPNIANVFKRTFYQMMFKFQIGAHPHCAGCIFALPASVWDSWQRHLGRPTLRERGDGTSALERPGEVIADHAPAWIYVFDLDAEVEATPSSVRIVKRIATSSDALAHYAVKVAPEAAVRAGGAADAIQMTIHRRLAAWWPELARAEVL